MPTEAQLEQLAGTRAWVHDPFTEQLPMDEDYGPILAQLEQPTVLIEWDLALTYEDRQRFTRVAEIEPDLVQVAPYKLYPCSTALARPVWAHRAIGRDGQYRWLDYQEAWCDLFSFGLVYLPGGLGPAYVEACPGRASDTTFSQWHHKAIGKPVPVHWNVRPVHLNYRP